MHLFGFIRFRLEFAFRYFLLAQEGKQNICFYSFNLHVCVHRKNMLLGVIYAETKPYTKNTSLCL